MDSNAIYDTFMDIAEFGAVSVKKVILEENTHEYMLTALDMIYNPYITYGLKKLPEHTTDGTKGITKEMMRILRAMSRRELTGNAAKDALSEELGNLHFKAREIVRWMLEKDAHCGLGVTLINSVHKGFIPKPAYMRCSTLVSSDASAWDWSKPHILQLKADGMFVNVTKTSVGVTVTSRNGQLYESVAFSEIIAQLDKTLKENWQAHGEVTVYKDGQLLSRKNGNGILNRALKSGDPLVEYDLVYDIWDAIPLSAITTTYDKPYIQRIKDVHALVGGPVHMIDSVEVYSLDEASKKAGRYIKRKLEGAVLKHRNGMWKDGTSKQQVKLKAEYVVELQVKGWTEGTGKNIHTFGSLECESKDGLVKANVAGFTDEMREEVARENMWINKIIAVRFADLVQDKKGEWSLFLPRFEEQRLDKHEADTLDDILEVIESAYKG